MQVKDIYLIRHGRVEGEPALYGSTDVQVSDDEQLRLACAIEAKKLNPNRILSSPLSRCRVLGERIAADADVSLDLLPCWQEMDFGRLDGVPFTQMSQDEQAQLAAFSAAPNEVLLPDAEPLREFHRRVTSQWEQIIDLSADNLVIIAHGGVIRMMIAHLLEMDWQHPNWYQKLHIGYGSLTHIRVYIDEQHPPWHSVMTIGQPL